jgi:hypothetical protein
MIRFSTVLAGLPDPASSPRNQTNPSRVILMQNVPDGECHNAPMLNLKKARAEYAAASFCAPPEPHAQVESAPGGGPETESIPNLEALLKELQVARHSIERLKSLRRKFAWICHPDRQPLGQKFENLNLMAELNMRIDAAMEAVAGRSKRGNQ